MKRPGLMSTIGIGALLGLSACVVQPAPVAVVRAPAPVVNAQPAPVVVHPRRWRACRVGYHLGPHGRHCRPNR